MRIGHVIQSTRLKDNGSAAPKNMSNYFTAGNSAWPAVGKQC